MSNNSLFDGPQLADDTDEQDARLKRQIVRVYEVMRDGKARTLDELAVEADAPAASVSARIRDLRKPRFGGFAVWTKDRGHGQFTYRLVPDSGDPQFVYLPAPEPRSPKQEARIRLRAFLNAWGETGRPDYVTGTGGNPLLISDIEAMLS